MSIESRQERLAAELHALRDLKASSSILDFECRGGAPDQYVMIFRGRGLRRRASAGVDVDFVDQHRMEIRLTTRYPARPPDIRWLTPLFHPNVAFGGLVSLADIGLQWNRDLGLDVICERLWDVARCCYVDLARSVNPLAKVFYAERRLRLPLDARTLRDRSPGGGVQVLRVQRTAAPRGWPAHRPPTPDLLVIDENTPTPELPRRAPLARGASGGEIFYIGEGED